MMGLYKRGFARQIRRAGGETRDHRFRLMRAPAALALLLALAMAAALPIGGRALAAEGGPMALVKALVNQALTVIADRQMSVAARADKLRTIVAGNFDFEAMARSALGYHWKRLSEDQRKQFTSVFTAFIEDAYLNRLTDYSGQKVAFLRESSEGPGYAQVNTQLVQQGKNPIPINYMLEKNGDDWKVYDVKVDAISIVANYRNQFNRVINNQGFDVLMKDLRSKQQSLAQSIGR